jgi:ketosteroid isomerase-like protein
VSQRNVELLRRSNELFRRGEWESWIANMDPDVVVRTDPVWPEQRIYGRDNVLAWITETWASLGPDLRIEEIADLGDRVLARNRWFTRGEHSGIKGEMRWSELITVREGRIVFIEMFFDHDDALRAVELEN